MSQGAVQVLYEKSPREVSRIVASRDAPSLLSVMCSCLLLLNECTGELQAIRHDRAARGVVVLHHTDRVPDEYSRVGTWRLQVRRLRQNRHTPVCDVPCDRMLAHSEGIPFLE